jgi:hypothetical protein
MAEQDKVAKPTALQDMEDRRAAELGKAIPSDLPARDFSGGREESELDGFVGVDPIYRNYANDVDKPLFSDGDSAEGFFEQKHTDSSDRIIVGDRDDDSDEKDDESSKKDDSSTKSQTTSSAPKTGLAAKAKSS